MAKKIFEHKSRYYLVKKDYKKESRQNDLAIFC